MIDTAREEGREEGRQAGQVDLILRLLTRKLGEIPEPIQGQILTLSGAEFAALEDAVFELQTITDLEAWLRSRP
ncbi:DUF4351 domain-containing protein [Spirulina major CS-329]|uniref:DUF4351 domain-containing protein n=1 Tax=Spirulina TaxID=1154 RepID=UPI00232BB67E|nr:MULTISPECIES: DUF4351 domain-containing protein [Spirulina]MDB9495928.1 DUF4351 domain-containing protein [Spirulina subsalsa CS-330]MDB9501498.1 DUF4351 domain-containing protein [Spirulina major CS-329]